MKKIIIGLFILMVSILMINKDDEILIPNNAIRFRVIANSSSVEDQLLKKQVKQQVQDEIYKLINGANNVEEVRTIINDNLDVIENIVDDYKVSYTINYGNNYFPLKNYKGVFYEPGNYESLVITLGDGLGENFWCVLFPPLCLMDNTEADVSDIDYQLYVKQLLDKF